MYGLFPRDRPSSKAWIPSIKASDFSREVIFAGIFFILLNKRAFRYLCYSRPQQPVCAILRGEHNMETPVQNQENKRLSFLFQRILRPLQFSVSIILRSGECISFLYTFSSLFGTLYEVASDPLMITSACFKLKDPLARIFLVGARGFASSPDGETSACFKPKDPLARIFLVGARGFEPPTSCTPCKRASRAAPRPDLCGRAVL